MLDLHQVFADEEVTHIDLQLTVSQFSIVLLILVLFKEGGREHRIRTQLVKFSSLKLEKLEKLSNLPLAAPHRTRPAPWSAWTLSSADPRIPRTS